MLFHHKFNTNNKKIRPLRLLGIIAILCFLASCGHNKVERLEQPADDLQVDFARGSMAVLRNPYVILSIRHIHEREWDELLFKKVPSFATAKNANFRVPKLLFFMVTIKNISGSAVFLRGADIVYGNEKYPSLTYNDLQRRFTSPSYRIFNFKEITESRRLLMGDIYMNLNSVFLEDSINYKLDFILPNDTVVKIMPFEYPPPTLLSYKLEFSVDSGRANRKLSFNVNRKEYRTNGNDFKRTPDFDEDILP